MKGDEPFVPSPVRAPGLYVHCVMALADCPGAWEGVGGAGEGRRRGGEKAWVVVVACRGCYINFSSFLSLNFHCQYF